MSDLARKQIDIDALDQLIAPLSAAVAALDSNEAAANAAGTSRTLGNGGSGGGLGSWSGSRMGAESGAGPGSGAGSGLGSGAGSASGISPGSGPGSVPGPAGVAAAGASASAPSAAAASAPTASTPASASATPGTATEPTTKSSSPGTTRTVADDATAESFGATAVLDRLALLPELKSVVGELRARKRDALDIHELADLLERVTRFATEQRMQVQKEKLELENIVQQLASRLEEISQHLTGELADRSAGQEDCEELNTRVTDEVKQLRQTAESASDIAALRQQLSTRLDAISSHLSDFRSREETRVRTYKDRVQRMRTRIAVLERESRTLHENLREEQRAAMMDALTGIPNRAAYDDRIDEEFKRWKRFERPVSIIAWDIDRFKTINDAYGHKAGDKVLRVIGQHLARHVRDTDFVGRYGGEEFVMLLVGTEVDEARAVADKIRLEIGQLGFHFHDHPVTITASCGITAFVKDDTPDIAFERADKALYRAKEAGRNCCIIA